MSWNRIEVSRATLSRSYLCFVIPLAIAFLLNARTLDGWWLNDDPQVVLHAADHSPIEVLTEPASWRELSTSNYTPLVSISFDADLALFGPDPRGFHLHNIALAALCGITLAFFIHLLLGATPLMASITASAFLASLPMLLVAGELMSRHYVASIILALLSLLAWNRAIERTSDVWSAAAAILYLLAGLAKEIALPLPLVMLAMMLARTEHKHTRRFLLLVPLILAGTIYLALRINALGTIGGYGEATPLFDTLFELGRLIGGGRYGALAAAGLVLVLLIESLRISSARIMIVISAALISIIAPLAGILDAAPRHALMPAAAIAILAAGIWKHSDNFTVRALSLVTIAILVVGGITGTGSFEQNREQMIAEGRYVYLGSEDEVLLAGSPGWYLSGLTEMARRFDTITPAPFILSRDGVVVSDIDTDRLVVSTPDGEIRPLEQEEQTEIEAERRNREADLPINVRMVRENSTISWQLGPDCDCQWIYMSLPGFDETTLSASGKRTIPPSTEKGRFVIRRIETNGAWNVTPPLSLPTPISPQIEWP